MEQQGAQARYANCGDDENSQAEGSSSEGAVGFSRSTNVDNTNNCVVINNNCNNNNNNNAIAPPTNPHYENIYESIDQYAAAAAAPADNIIVPSANNFVCNNAAPSSMRLQPNNNNGIGIASISSNNGRNAAVAAAASSSSAASAHRNELYDRTAGYDVPRQSMRNNANFPTYNSTSKRRANLHLDLNPNRPRYTTASRPHRQRSFDDTESYYNNNYRCENIYEQIHEEPIYRNVSSTGSANGSRGGMYGRLGVIGHGIGRIERHLSSSCGNIDHFNLGGHYAVLGHSHLGTVGHIRLNAAAAAPNNTKDSTTTAKTLNFFSCLGRENSQSMNNIHRASASAPAAGNSAPVAAGGSFGGCSPSMMNNGTTASTSSTAAQPTRSTGAVPKSKTKSSSQKTYDRAPAAATTNGHADNTLNRISKSSLQWLLVNKWLPLWMGQGPDYNILDFNFMFSRNCDGCYDSIDRQQGVVRFNGHAEMRPHTEPPSRAYSTAANPQNGIGGSMRPMRMNHSLNRLREYDRGSLLSREGSLDERTRFARDCANSNVGPYERNRFRDAMIDRSMRIRTESEGSRSNSLSDPFRNWELNTENNSFRPAGGGGMTRDIRRITDGTYPSSTVTGTQNQPDLNAKVLPVQQQSSIELSSSSSPMRRLPQKCEILSVGVASKSSSSGTVVASTSSCGVVPSTSTASSTTKTIERVSSSPKVSSVLDSRTESGNDSPSPDLGRRFSDDTEDDQHNDQSNDNNESSSNNETDELEKSENENDELGSVSNKNDN